MTNVARGVKHGKRDHNHRDVVSNLRILGCSVEDLADRGSGSPDIIARPRNGSPEWIEIKNGDTAYGRRGLNPLQRAWADKGRWTVYIVATEEDARNFANGALHMLSSYAGRK